MKKIKFDNYFLSPTSGLYKFTVDEALAELIIKYGKLKFENRIFVYKSNRIYYKHRLGLIPCGIKSEKLMEEVRKEMKENDAGTRTDESDKD